MAGGRRSFLTLAAFAAPCLPLAAFGLPLVITLPHYYSETLGVNLSAVSLAFVVPVTGECHPTQQALDLAWFTPEQAVSTDVIREMTSGHDRLIRLALASVGQLP